MSQGKNLGFQESHGRKKNTSAAEGGQKILAFFFVENHDFSGKMTNFRAFWNFTDVRFATFSVLAGVSFGENEISTDVRFRTFFWRHKRTRGGRKKNSRLSPTVLGPQSPVVRPKWRKTQNVTPWWLTLKFEAI